MAVVPGVMGSKLSYLFIYQQKPIDQYVVEVVNCSGNHSPKEQTSNTSGRMTTLAKHPFPRSW